MTTSTSAPADLDPRILLRRLEVRAPQCGCRQWLPQCEALGMPCVGECTCNEVLTPPCRHVLGRDHAMPLGLRLDVRNARYYFPWQTPDSWAELIYLGNPKAHREPPPPPYPALVLSQEARIALYARRHRLGYSLFHPRDLHDEDADALGRMAHRHRNGPAFQGDMVIGRELLELK